jgi:DNA-binding MarR family transcriptional regulator
MQDVIEQLAAEMQDVMHDLSPNQAACLSFVVDYFRVHRQYPTYEEIAQHMGVSRQHIGRHLSALERKGYIRRIPAMHSRNVRVTEEGIRKILAISPEALGQKNLFETQQP